MREHLPAFDLRGCGIADHESVGEPQHVFLRRRVAVLFFEVLDPSRTAVLHIAFEDFCRRLQESRPLRDEAAMKQTPSLFGIRRVHCDRRHRRFIFCFSTRLDFFACVLGRFRKPFMRDRLRDVDARLDGFFLRFFYRVAQVFCVLFYACQRVRFRREGDGFQERRRRIRLRILFDGDEEIAAMLDGVFDGCIRKLCGFCHRFEVGKAAFFFQGSRRVDIDVFKARAAHLGTDELSLHVGRCLFELGGRGDLLESSEHDGSRHGRLYGAVCLCLFRRESMRVPYSAARQMERAARKTEAERRRDSFCPCNSGVRRDVGEAVVRLCCTSVGRGDDVVMDEVVGDGLCAFFRRFRRRDLQDVFDLIFGEDSDRFALAEIVFRAVDDAFDRRFFDALCARFSRKARQGLEEHSGVPEFDAGIESAAERGTVFRFCVRHQGVAVRVGHFAVFEEAPPRFRLCHAVERTALQAPKGCVAKCRASCLTPRRRAEHRANGGASPLAPRRCTEYAAQEADDAARRSEDCRTAARLDRRAGGSRCDHPRPSPCAAFSDAVEHLRRRRRHAARYGRERIVEERRQILFLVLLEHLFEFGSACMIVLICRTHHDFCADVVKLQLLFAHGKKVRERLDDAMRLPHGLDVVERERRIARTHLRHLTKLRELLPDRLHRKVFLHCRFSFVREVVDLEGFFVGDVIV